MQTSSTPNDLYAEFGRAAEKAQVLEVEAGNVALAYHALRIGMKQSVDDTLRAELQAVMDDVNRKTLGTVLNQIKSIMGFDDAILTAIDDALERRNYLMHKFFRNHNFAIFHADGIDSMIVELKQIQSKLDRALAMLTAISEILLQMAGYGGLSEEAAKALQARARRVDI
jgi:hypothetical protein